MEESVPVVQDSDEITTGLESSTIARDRAVKQMGLDKYKNRQSASMVDSEKGMGQ